MSDSGRQIDDCIHGKDKAYCVECLRSRVQRLENTERKLLAALQKIVELEGDSEQQQFKTTRFQASLETARAAINETRNL